MNQNFIPASGRRITLSLSARLQNGEIIDFWPVNDSVSSKSTTARLLHMRQLTPSTCLFTSKGVFSLLISPRLDH